MTNTNPLTAQELLAIVALIVGAGLSGAALATSICLTIFLNGKWGIGIFLSSLVMFFGVLKLIFESAA